MNGRTTISVTLIVKGEAEVAIREVERRLGPTVIGWFTEDGFGPYPEGSLLWYRVGEVGKMNVPNPELIF
jgi:hypothetical protein